jgi:hypothetical protein
MTLQHSLVHSIRLVWPMQLARVLLCPQLIFPFKTSFFGIYLEFSAPEITLKINISHVFESKSYQINSIKSYSSRSFHQHQRHKPGLRPGLGTSSCTWIETWTWSCTWNPNIWLRRTWIETWFGNFKRRCRCCCSPPRLLLHPASSSSPPVLP